MNGHQPLIAMRANGIKPKAVWICDSDGKWAVETSKDWSLQRNVSDRAWHATIRVLETDMPETLDLRWLTGLTVHVESDRSPARMHRLFDACVESGAALVVGVANGEVLWHKV